MRSLKKRGPHVLNDLNDLLKLLTWVKLRTSNLADIFRWSMRTKADKKIWEKMERGRIQGLPNFFEYPPPLSQKRVKLRTSNLVRTFLVSIGTKVHYRFLEK